MTDQLHKCLVTLAVEVMRQRGAAMGRVIRYVNDRMEDVIDG